MLTSKHTVLNAELAHTVQGRPGSRGGDANCSALKLVPKSREQREAALRNRPKRQARPRAKKAVPGDLPPPFSGQNLVLGSQNQLSELLCDPSRL